MTTTVRTYLYALYAMSSSPLLAALESEVPADDGYSEYYDYYTDEYDEGQEHDVSADAVEAAPSSPTLIHPSHQWDPQTRFFSHVLTSLRWTGGAAAIGVVAGILGWLVLLSLSHWFLSRWTSRAAQAPKPAAAESSSSTLASVSLLALMKLDEDKRVTEQVSVKKKRVSEAISQDYDGESTTTHF